MKSSISRILSLLLALSLAGATEVAQAWQTTMPAQPQQTQQTPGTNQQAPAANQPPAPTTGTQTTPATGQNPAPATENNASDPTHVPAPAEVLPNAPEAPQDQQVPTTTTPAAPTTTQQPLGTAAAEKGVTRGGAASKPAGTAVAGKKQKQSRGLLIKVGAALAAGAALGTVYALSKGTSPTPPGATRPAVR